MVLIVFVGILIIFFQISSILINFGSFLTKYELSGRWQNKNCQKSRFLLATKKTCQKYGYFILFTMLWLCHRETDSKSKITNPRKRHCRKSALHFSVQVLSESLKMIFFGTNITDFPRNLKNIVIHYFKISSALHISSIFLIFLVVS